MKRADTLAGAILLAFFLLVLVESSRMPLVYLTAIGPGFLPVGASLILVTLSALLLISGLRGSAGGDQEIDWPGGRGLARIAGIVAGLVVYTLMMPILGYVFSTFGFLFVLIWMLAPYRWYWSAGISLALAVTSYTVFQLWLGLILPRGVLLIP